MFFGRRLLPVLTSELTGVIPVQRNRWYEEVQFQLLKWGVVYIDSELLSACCCYTTDVATSVRSVYIVATQCCSYLSTISVVATSVRSVL